MPIPPSPVILSPSSFDNPLLGTACHLDAQSHRVSIPHSPAFCSPFMARLAFEWNEDLVRSVKGARQRARPPFLRSSFRDPNTISHYYTRRPVRNGPNQCLMVLNGRIILLVGPCSDNCPLCHLRLVILPSPAMLLCLVNNS